MGKQNKMLREANSRTYALKEKDKELLKLAEKASELDKLMTNIRYYSKEDQDKENKRKIINSKIRVYTIEDLIYKYEYYGPTYYEKDNSFVFSKALPMEVFTMFRYDSAKFNFTEFIIQGEDPNAGYRTCREM